MNDLKAMHQKRGDLVANMREVMNRASLEKRSLTEDEQKQFDQMNEDQMAMGETIKREEELGRLEAKATLLKEDVEKTALHTT